MTRPVSETALDGDTRQDLQGDFVSARRRPRSLMRRQPMRRTTWPTGLEVRDVT